MVHRAARFIPRAPFETAVDTDELLRGCVEGACGALLAAAAGRVPPDLVNPAVLANPLFAEIVSGAERALRESGYSMLLTNSEGDPELDLAHVRLFEQRRTDGLILSLADETYEPTLEELRRLRVPFVLADRELHDGLPFSAVHCDEEAAMPTSHGHDFRALRHVTASAPATRHAVSSCPSRFVAIAPASRIP